MILKVIYKLLFDQWFWSGSGPGKSGSGSDSGSGADQKSKKIPNFLFLIISIKNIILKTMIYSLLVISLLFIYINQKSALFLKTIWYSYNFGWFFMCYPDPYRIRFLVSLSGSGSGQVKRIRIHNAGCFWSWVYILCF